MATLLEQTEHQRLERMRHHAEFLARRGYLRSDVRLSEATDILWTRSSTELYELLVLQRKWPQPRFA